MLLHSLQLGRMQEGNGQKYGCFDSRANYYTVNMGEGSGMHEDVRGRKEPQNL